MSEKTKISWCDSTINFWSGCTKVSAGCANCYAEELGKRFPTFGKWGKGAPRKLHEGAFKDALRLNRKPWVCECGKAYSSRVCVECSLPVNRFHRRRIFSLSLGDWLDPEVPVEWLARMLDTIRQCSDVEWILCTKRPELWRERLVDACKWNENNHGAFECHNWILDWLDSTHIPSNITLLASVENQQAADERIPHLLRIPAARRGLSCEPLLGPVDLTRVNFTNGKSTWTENVLRGEVSAQAREVLGRDFKMNTVDWLIIGGESGPNARPCQVEWIRSLVAQGKASGVATFVKQLGAFCIEEHASQRKRILHDHPKGGDPAEWPENLRIQEWPTI